MLVQYEFKLLTFKNFEARVAYVTKYLKGQLLIPIKIYDIRN